MKKLLLPFLFLALVSCGKDDDTPVKHGERLGCQSGILINGGTERVLIRCCTRDEHVAGSNTNHGGIQHFDNYKKVRWTPVSNCNECNVMDYSTIE